MSAPARHLRLAMVSYGLPVAHQRRGGIERAAHTLADGLAGRGHDVTVFTHDPRPDGARYRVAPLPWKAFVETWIGRRVTMGYLGNVLMLVPDYREFDAVIMHGDSLLAWLTGKPVARVMHGSALGEARSATSPGRAVLQCGVYVQELVTAFCQRGVVAVSENTRHENPFIDLVIPHGVDTSIFRPGQAPRSGEPNVLFVGSLDGRKRGRFLLEGFLDVIRREHPDASLTMVGATGPAHAGVTWLTGVPDLDLARLYQRAWVYASPSTYEGFGLPYLEAMACGTPVVASSNPGSLEVLGDGRWGLTPSDEDFACTVSALLADASRREALAHAGLIRSQAFTLDTMLDGYEQVLFDLAGIRAGSVASV
jgi:glycosyltransferase involved in cell wall biosynthesis